MPMTWAAFPDIVMGLTQPTQIGIFSIGMRSVQVVRHLRSFSNIFPTFTEGFSSIL